MALPRRRWLPAHHAARGTVHRDGLAIPQRLQDTRDVGHRDALPSVLNRLLGQILGPERKTTLTFTLRQNGEYFRCGAGWQPARRLVTAAGPVPARGAPKAEAEKRLRRIPELRLPVLVGQVVNLRRIANPPAADAQAAILGESPTYFAARYVLHAGSPFPANVRIHTSARKLP